MRLRHFVTAAKVLIGGGLIWWLLRDATARDVWEIVAGADPWLIAASIACFVVVVALNALRWRIVFDIMGTRLSIGVAMLGTYEGMFFNLFLPTGVGGDVVRAYRAYDHGLTARQATEGALIDRALGLWGLAAAILVASLFSSGLRQVPGWQLIVGFAAIIVIGGIGAGWIAALLPARASRRGVDALLGILAGYAAVVRGKRFWAEIVPLLAVANLLIGVSAWLIALGIGMPVGLADMTVVIEGGALTAMIPVSIGGWGVREGTVVFLLVAMGFARGPALAASALMGLVLAVLGLIGAAVWIGLPYKRRPGVGPHAARDRPRGSQPK